MEFDFFFFRFFGGAFEDDVEGPGMGVDTTFPLPLDAKISSISDMAGAARPCAAAWRPHCLLIVTLSRRMQPPKNTTLGATERPPPENHDVCT